MITSSIPDSLLCRCPPGDGMLCDLPLILSIGNIRVIILIYDDYTPRYSLHVSYNIDEDRDMLLRSICESIVRLSIEAGDDESLEVRREMTLHSRRETKKRLSAEPLICREWPLLRYHLRECSTLPSILGSHSCLRELWIETISCIADCPWTRTMSHHEEILTLDRWISCHEYRTTWHDPLFPVFCLYSIDKWEDIRVGGLERREHKS